MDQKLIARASQNDEAAFCELVSACQEEVYRLCYYYSENTEAAYNLAADSFRKVRNAIALYPESEEFHLWLIRIVCITCRESHMRKGDNLTALAAILQKCMHFSEADTAYLLDRTEAEIRSCDMDSYDLSAVPEPSGTHDLAAGFRQSLKAEKQRQNPLKILSHFRFTFVAILIVLILLLASHIRSASSGQSAASASATAQSVKEAAVTADTAREFLPAQNTSNES